MGFPFVVVVAALLSLLLLCRNSVKESLLTQPRLASNPPSFCLTLPSTRVTSLCHFAWLVFVCLLVITTIRFKHSEHVLANGLLNVY